MKYRYSFSLLSSYRTELMGMAIVGVLIMHWMSIGEIPHNIMTSIAGVFPAIAFTESFLFLSGLGIYRSLYKDCNFHSFFKKRIKRLVIPYLLIAFFPMLAYVLINNESFGTFILKLSTFDFWLGEGNMGMWYVSVTVFLYFISPLLFKLKVFDKTWRIIMVVGGGHNLLICDFPL